jgi:hypothetical protein
MKHMLRFRIAVACYSCYICGQFLGSLFMYQNSKIGAIAAVAIPTLVLFLYISIITRQVQPKKKLPRRNVRIAR